MYKQKISSHESLASMLAMPQMRATKVEDLPNEPDQISVTYEGSPCPRELLESCVIQATAALNGLEAMFKREKEKAAAEADKEAKLRQTVEQARQETLEKTEQAKNDEGQQLKQFW
jgi:hypothetical protein